MTPAPPHRRSLSAGASSVLASWLLFAGLLGVAGLGSVLDGPALAGLVLAAVNALAGLAVARLRSR